MTYFNVVAETNQNTVVTSYEPLKTRSEAYQSEAALEAEFIRMLTEQGYTRLHIHSESELIANLRTQLEKLNDIQFSDAEWERFFTGCIANPNEHIIEKTRKIDLVCMLWYFYLFSCNVSFRIKFCYQSLNADSFRRGIRI